MAISEKIEAFLEIDILRHLKLGALIEDCNDVKKYGMVAVRPMDAGEVAELQTMFPELDFELDKSHSGIRGVFPYFISISSKS